MCGDIFPKIFKSSSLNQTREAVGLANTVSEPIDDKDNTNTDSSSPSSIFDFDLGLAANLDMPPIDLLNTDSSALFQQLDGIQYESSDELDMIGASGGLLMFDTSTPTDFDHDQEVPNQRRYDKEFVANETYELLDENGSTLPIDQQDEQASSSKLVNRRKRFSYPTTAQSHQTRFKLNDFVCINRKKFGFIKFEVFMI